MRVTVRCDGVDAQRRSAALRWPSERDALAVVRREKRPSAGEHLAGVLRRERRRSRTATARRHARGAAAASRGLTVVRSARCGSRCWPVGGRHHRASRPREAPAPPLSASAALSQLLQGAFMRGSVASLRAFRPTGLSDSRAMLITVEGLDGAGKTTLIAGLARALGATVLREPGGVELSERIRELVADPELARRPARGGAAVRRRAGAARRGEARPAARRRRDRAAGPLRRLLARLPGRRPRARRRGDPRAERVRHRRPDARPHAAAAHRPGARAWRGSRAATPTGSSSAGGEFFARVAQTYDELAAAEPDRFVVLDATQPPDTVLSAALKALT